MIKKTALALSVATLATGAAVLPTAAVHAGDAPTAVQLAACGACSPCKAKACGACNPCAAKACSPCNPCNPCAAKACSPCNPCNPCAAKSN